MTRHGSCGLVRRVACVLCAACVLCVSGFRIDDARGQHANPLDHEGGAPPSIQALTMTDGGILYAGSFGFGVFVSHDRGGTWTSINRRLGDRFILSLSADDEGTVYAGTVRGGVFRTLDDGTTWEPLNTGLRSVEVKALLTRHGAVYAGTGHGVYRFDEAARRWIVVASGLEGMLVTSLAITKARHLFAGTAGQGLYRLDTASPDAVEWERVGETLTDPREGLPQTYIRVTAVSPDQHLYVGTFDGGVYRSRDAGTTWRPVGRSLPNDSIRGIVATATALYVATGRGIFTHNLQDAAWVSVNEGLTEQSVQTLIGTPEGVLYAGTSAGAFRRRDTGRHWVNISATLGRHHSIPPPYF